MFEMNIFTNKCDLSVLFLISGCLGICIFNAVLFNDLYTYINFDYKKQVGELSKKAFDNNIPYILPNKSILTEYMLELTLNMAISPSALLLGWLLPSQ